MNKVEMFKADLEIRLREHRSYTVSFCVNLHSLSASVVRCLN
jgi:hypothetical protein